MDEHDGGWWFSRRTVLRSSAVGLAGTLGLASSAAGQEGNGTNTTSGTNATRTNATTGGTDTGNGGRAQLILSFDDGEPSAKTVAKPIMDQYGYRGITGISTGRIAQDGEDDELTVEQLTEMQAEGWEIASHTVSHPTLTEISESEVREECRQSRQFIAENGLLPPETTIIYPSGGVDDTVARIAGEFYDYGFGGTDDPTDGIDQPLQISRAAGQEPSEGREQIDRAIENGGVSVLMFHRVGDFDEPKDSDIPESEFADLMSYIDEQGDAIEVVTATEL